MGKVAVVSTVKTPIDELQLYVNYHFNVGVDKFFLFFDDPEDCAFKLLDHESEIKKIKCDDHYWSEVQGERPVDFYIRQTINATHACRLAEEEDFDWSIHIDDDELIHSSEPFKHLLDQCDADVVRFELYEGVTQNIDCQVFETALFRVEKPSKRALKLARILIPKDYVGKKNFFRGHTHSKLAIKLNGKVEELGIHKVNKSKESLKIVEVPGLSLLHFDSIGFKKWESKLSNIADNLEKFPQIKGRRKGQLQYYIQ